MSIDVAVVDYGIGNLFSVRRALEHAGATVAVSSDPAVLSAAPRLVLPGVGSFADGMDGLRSRGLDTVVRQFAETGRPLLGICLGMQMLADGSDEFGDHDGLGLIPGRVRPVPAVDIDGRAHKIPHVGWARLINPPDGHGWQATMLADVPEGESVYLVHSFAMQVAHRAHCLAECSYNGQTIVAAIQRANVSGTQFHPEKSGTVGLGIVAGFLRQGQARL